LTFQAICQEIEHGGFEAGVAQVALDDAEIDAGFEEMGGVALRRV
jgi:hypothetical protein